MKKLLLLAVPMMLGIVSCGTSTPTSSAPKSNDAAGSSAAAPVSEDSQAEAKAAKLTQGFSSPAQFAYMNARPQYNYYTTTFVFETLDLFDDNTYQFNVISMTFSGVVLPEEGSDGSGNERENSVVRYYGTYTSAEDELDPEILSVSLADPSRIVAFSDAAAFYDTANWTDAMSKAAGSHIEYDENYQQHLVEGEKSAADYLKENAFAAMDIEAVPSQGKIDFVAPVVPEGGNAKAKLSTEKDGLVNGFSSAGQFAYMNHRPQYNYYTTTFAMQTLETYEDGSYALNLYTSTFSGVVLPEEGSDGTGNERENSQFTSFGTYTSAEDELDPEILAVSLSESKRLVVRNDAAAFYDTDNWTAAMSKAAGSHIEYDENYQQHLVEGEKTAAEYLSENKLPAVEAEAVPTQGKLDFIVFAD